mgnify:CR=1 FL=1
MYCVYIINMHNYVSHQRDPKTIQDLLDIELNERGSYGMILYDVFQVYYNISIRKFKLISNSNNNYF